MLEDRSYMREPAYGAYRPLTVVLLVALVVCFVLQLFLTLVIPPAVFYDWLALTKSSIRYGFVWQFFTFQFLHGGLLHLIFNGLTLYSFGRPLESNLSRKQYLMLYFGSGVAGGLFHVFGHFLAPTYFGGSVVGASAGIAGLVAAFAFLYPRQFVYFFGIIPIPAFVFFILGIVVSIYGLLVDRSPIAHGAHLGGLLFGYAYVRWLMHYDLKLPRLNFVRQPKVFVRGRRPRRWSSSKPPQEFEVPSEEFISREVDPILDKISAHGIQSLTESERKILEAARAKMAKR